MVRALLALAFVFTAGGVSDVAAQADSLLVSGHSTLGYLDGNGDGPDDEDCFFSGEIDPGGSLTIFGFQDTNFPMRACSGNYMGFGSAGSDSSSNFVSALFYSSTLSPSPGSLPLSISAFQEVPNPDGSLPVILSKVIDGITLAEGDEFESAGSASLCGSGSFPASRITLADGSTIMRPGEVVDGDPPFLRLPGIPVEEASPNLGMFALRDGYIPMTPEGRITVATESAPDELLLIIDIARLQPCAGQIAAPAVSSWAIAAMLLSLLAITTWRLRRSAAYSSLLQPRF